jgi:HD-GYP domain-containing protein (c-di-GMP phosphodiesterase class II)
MSEIDQKLHDVISLDSEINKVQDVDILLEMILRQARRVVHADAGSIYIKKDDGLEITYAQNDTLQKDLPPGEKLMYSIFTVPINKKTISGYAAATGEAVNIEDVYDMPSNALYGFNPQYDKLSGYETHSNLTIPLQTNTSEIIGVLQMINAMDEEGKVKAFSEEDELLATHFAANATVALQRAQMTRAILLRMIKMAELRDPKETGTHVNRVAGYSVEIYERWAKNNGLPDKEIEKNRDILRMAAMLHDVGKVAISDTILKKPARFTDEEYEIMKSHTVEGARVFWDKQSEFDDIAQIVALNHHENWDGTGYPGHIDIETGEPLETDGKGKARGKKGEEIPIFGQVVGVADVYDALSSKRVYKNAWSEKDVLDEMKKMTGTKFNPDLIDVFFSVLPSIKTISDKYQG